MKHSKPYRVVSRDRGTREHESLGGACLDCQRGEIIERRGADGTIRRVRDCELPKWARKAREREG